MAERTGFTLDRFLKYHSVVESGGMAKLVIQDGAVTVNGVVETRRRRQLAPGDVVEFDGEQLVVPPAEDPPTDAPSAGG